MLGLRADFDDLRAREESSLNKLFELHARPVREYRCPPGRSLSARITPRCTPSSLQISKMLPGLGLDQFVRRDHQQNQVNPGSPRKHVFHKPLVARHIDETVTARLPLPGTRNPDQS